jgi:hypothetical protein
MPQVGFGPTIPVFEQAKRVHALEHAAGRCGRLINTLSRQNTSDILMLKQVVYTIITTVT